MQQLHMSKKTAASRKLHNVVRSQHKKQTSRHRAREDTGWYSESTGCELSGVAWLRVAQRAAMWHSWRACISHENIQEGKISGWAKRLFWKAEWHSLTSLAGPSERRSTRHETLVFQTNVQHFSNIELSFDETTRKPHREMSRTESCPNMPAAPLCSTTDYPTRQQVIRSNTH